MSILSQRSFAGGEIAPALYSRRDQVKYETGLRTCRNFTVMRHGGVQNRPGTQYIGEVKDSDKTVRLVKFVYNAAQTYVLEFGDQYIRFIQDGTYLTVSGVAAWANTTAYVVGDLVSYSGVNYYCYVAHTSATANDRPSTGTNWESYWHVLTDDIYEIPTPYGYADLADIVYVQSADVMTFAHEDYPIQVLARNGATNWTLTERNTVTRVSPPTGVSNTGGAAEAQKAITSMTFANPAVFTYNAHGYSNDDVVQVDFYVTDTYTGSGSGLPFGISPQKRITFSFTAAIKNITANTFELRKTGDTANFDLTPTGMLRSYATGTGYVVRTGTSAAITYAAEYVVTAVDDDGFESPPSLLTGTTSVASSGSPVNITWTAVSGVQRYNIYKKKSGGSLYGFIGSADRTLFTDRGVEPDETFTAPFPDDLFSASGDYPGVVGYYQQRLLFGRTSNKPETVWASRSGDFNNFTKREPIQDDDRVQFTLAGRLVNSIRHMLDLGTLVVLTDSGEFAIKGDAAGVLTPTDINSKQYGYNGSSTLPPLVIGNNALYVQARGSRVRDLSLEVEVQTYRGNDLTIFAAHLLDDYTLVDWDFAQIPHNHVWAVRNDGTLLCLTYVPEHQVWGWSRHDTAGAFENVCVVPEGTEDAVYVVVRREVDGDTVRYVERLHTRRVDEDAIMDSVFVDASLTYDGRATNRTMTLSGGTTWERGETLTLTASAGTFVDGTGATRTTFEAGDVGNEIHITAADGTQYRCSITAYTSATVVSVTVNRDVPVGLQAVAQSTWAKAVDEFTGLGHLEGEDVSVFADGFVVANPNVSSYDVVTVASGAVTLPRCYAVVHIGLPYTSDLETLDMDTVQGETLVDKKKLVNKVTLMVEKSRGGWFGTEAPEDDTIIVDGDDRTSLYELKQRASEGYDDPVSLATEPVDIDTQAGWNSNGRVFVRQSDPLPMTVLSINPAGFIPLRP